MSDENSQLRIAKLEAELAALRGAANHLLERLVIFENDPKDFVDAVDELEKIAMAAGG